MCRAAAAALNAAERLQPCHNCQLEPLRGSESLRHYYVGLGVACWGLGAPPLSGPARAQLPGLQWLQARLALPVSFTATQAHLLLSAALFLLDCWS